MNIFIYDTSLTLLGVIDDPISLIWTRRYWECGEFKLLIGYSDFNRDMLSMGNIITIQGYGEAGQISYVAITKDEKGEQIEIQEYRVSESGAKRYSASYKYRMR